MRNISLLSSVVNKALFTPDLICKNTQVLTSCLGVFLLSACLPPPDPPEPVVDAGEPLPPYERCRRTYAAPIDVAPVVDPAITEASGLVSSRQNAGVLWTHNDSGDSARLFALGIDGSALGRLYLPDVEAIDVEDMAAAPCPDGQPFCLWVADMGDNILARDHITIYIVPEPAINFTDTFSEADLADEIVSGARIEANHFWVLDVTYPDTSHDSEALVISPNGQELAVFEKTIGDQATIFHANLLEKLDATFFAPVAADVDANLNSQTTTTGSLTLDEVTTISSPGIAFGDQGRMITAADWHPLDQQMILRVYTATIEYRFDGTIAGGLADEDATFLDKLLLMKEQIPLTAIAGPLTEPQGEAVAYDETGLNIWSLSEDPDGQPHQMLHLAQCE